MRFVVNYLHGRTLWQNIWIFVLLKKLLNVNFVRDVLLVKIKWIYINDYTLGRNLLNVIYVVNNTIEEMQWMSIERDILRVFEECEIGGGKYHCERYAQKVWIYWENLICFLKTARKKWKLLVTQQSFREYSETFIYRKKLTIYHILPFTCRIFTKVNSKWDFA